MPIRYSSNRRGHNNAQIQIYNIQRLSVKSVVLKAIRCLEGTKSDNQFMSQNKTKKKKKKKKKKKDLQRKTTFVFWLEK